MSLEGCCRGSVTQRLFHVLGPVGKFDQMLRANAQRNWQNARAFDQMRLTEILPSANCQATPTDQY